MMLKLFSASLLAEKIQFIFNRYAKVLRRFLFYLVEDVRLAYYGLLFLFGVPLLSLVYFLLTPYSHGIGNNGLPLQDYTFWDSLYFSVVTVSSLGYGDMHPMGFSKFLACAEVLTGLMVLGILLAKLTSARLSHHVSRLYKSEIQKVLEEFTAGFNNLQSRLREATKNIGQAFQPIPDSQAPKETTTVAEKFSEAIISFHSRSAGITHYLLHEVEHDYFTLAPIDALVRTAEAIDRATDSLGQMILSMSQEARKSIIDTASRNLILDSLEEQRRMSEIVNDNCKDESIVQKFAQIVETMKHPKSLIAVPIEEIEAEQPDHKLEETDQPLTE